MDFGVIIVKIYNFLVHIFYNSTFYIFVHCAVEPVQVECSIVPFRRVHKLHVKESRFFFSFF